MSSTNFNAHFVENNFLSVEDWDDSHHLDASLAFQDSPECADNDTESLLTNWSTGSSSQSPNVYLEHENETNMMDFSVEDLLKTVHSPPLTPPDEKIDVDDLLIDSVPTSHIEPMTCEELMNGIETVCVDNVVPASTFLRDRSNSNESSSTSAYSSQSATPPPKPQSADVYENLFFTSSPLIQNPTDEGFHETSVPCSLVTTHEKVNSKKFLKSKSRKTAQKRQSSTYVCDEDTSDFDRKVEEALKETNRLLNMHKMDPCSPPKSSLKSTRADSVDKGDKPTVNLKELCDKTIMNSQSQNPSADKSKSCKGSNRRKGNPTKNVDAAEAILKELKQRACERAKAQSNDVSSSTTIPSSVIVTNLTVSNAPTIVKQTCQIPLRTSVQAPITCTLPINSEPPVKIIVKQEPVSQIYLATTTSNNTPVTIIRTTVQNAVGRTISATPASTITPISKKAEIPLHSLVIKPEKSIRSNPALRTVTSGQPAIKVVASSSLSRLVAGSPNVAPKPAVSGTPNSNTVKTVPKPSAKPLMVSQPAKKPIVPNGNAVYPSSLLMQSTMPPKPKADPVPLSCMDPETQNRVLKRQQRMIKNREWACQSRQRRKEYINMLEQRMSACVDDNNKLRVINTQLKERINELEKENATLRVFANTSNVTQRKAACVLMLIFFIGFNVKPLGFANFGRSSDMDLFGPNMGHNNNTGRKNWDKPADSGFHGRQLLAVVDAEGEGIKQEANMKQNESSDSDFTKLQIKQEYWMDDMVKSYKKQHISRILEILQATSPVPLQRLLRRKLKEELGLRLPLPGSRTRRISYTPSRRAAAARSDFSSVSYPDLEQTSRQKTKLPPPPPSVKHDDSSPCEKLGKSFDQPNQTDSIRVSDHLAKWIEQHEDQQRKDKTTTVTEQKPDYKSVRVQKSRRKRRESTSPNRETIKSSVPAVYEKRDKKLKRLLEAMERKNDTIYMISFSKDHILLPASVLDSSGHTKMSLVLPTVPPNDTFVTIDQTAMIQINCEVRSTNYVKIDRELLASVGFNSRKSNEKYDQQRPNENPKRKAFHGSISSAIKQKRKQIREKFANQDEDATVTDEVDL